MLRNTKVEPRANVENLHNEQRANSDKGVQMCAYKTNEWNVPNDFANQHEYYFCEVGGSSTQEQGRPSSTAV